MRPKVVSMFLAVFAVVVAASPVAADTRDIDQGFNVSFFPCLPGAPTASVPPSSGPGNDGAFAQICFVNVGARAGWQASTGEWILFRLRLGPFGSQPDCASANPAATAVLDGDAAMVDVACLQAPPGFWVASFRVLSRPLTPGAHSVAMAVSLNGNQATVSDSVTVVPGG